MKTLNNKNNPPTIYNYWNAPNKTLWEGWERLVDLVPVYGYGWHAKIKIKDSTIMARGTTRKLAINALAAEIIDHLTEPQW